MAGTANTDGRRFRSTRRTCPAPWRRARWRERAVPAGAWQQQRVGSSSGLLVDDVPLDPVALAAEQRDRLAALVRDLDVVNPRAPRDAALPGDGGQHVAFARRREE